MTLAVLSFNCWGLKYVSKDRDARIRAIAQELANKSYDIIGLQELWVVSDYEYIRSRIAKQLPHAKFFYSGALGSGLALFSKYPILASSLYPYSLNGSPMDVAGGDWIVGKAAASILIEVPELGLLETFNTHFHARGGEDGPELRRAHRLGNAWEFSKLILQSAERGRSVIAMGDLNSTPTTLPMQLVIKNAHVQDAWIVCHPSAANETSFVSSPLVAVQELGITCDSPLNTYSRGKHLSEYAMKHHGKRLDYILFRQPPGHFKTLSSLQCTSCNVVFCDPAPDREHSFSDHFGVEASFSVQTNLMNGERAQPLRTPEDGVHPPSVEAAIQALMSYYPIGKKQASSYLSLFYICIFIIIGLIVGSAFLPKSSFDPIFVFLVAGVAWLATTSFYMGFIFGRWEARALTNLIEEMELAQRSSRLSSGGQIRTV